MYIPHVSLGVVTLEEAFDVVDGELVPFEEDETT
jgi:hypothetical protein